MPKVCNLSPERQDAIRHASRERTRVWHEQRTAANRCHRCPRLVEKPGWFCRRCRIETAQHRARARHPYLLGAPDGDARVLEMRNQ